MVMLVIFQYNPLLGSVHYLQYIYIYLMYGVTQRCLFLHNDFQMTLPQYSGWLTAQQGIYKPSLNPAV